MYQRVQRIEDTGRIELELQGVLINARGMTRQASSQSHSTETVQEGNQITRRQSKSRQDVRINTLYRRSETCDHECSCACHRRQALSILEWLCGSVFVGYVGLPYITPSCNEGGCKRGLGPNIQITYYFPWWFCVKLGWLLTLKMDFPSPELSLKVVRPVPKDAHFFHLAASGDIESIKDMFRERKAHHLDVSVEDGRSALHVSASMIRPCGLIFSVPSSCLNNETVDDRCPVTNSQM